MGDCDVKISTHKCYCKLHDALAERNGAHKLRARLLHQIAREIGSGSIDSDPVAHGLQDRACQHCDFAAACGFQEGRGGDRVRYIRSVDPGEFWKFVEEESREEGSPCR